MDGNELEEGEIVESPPKAPPSPVKPQRSMSRDPQRIPRSEKLHLILKKMTYPTVNRYKTIEVVGEGTFGTVWLAQSETGRMVALKQIRFKRTRSGFPINLLRELFLLEQLDNKHILSMLDVTTDKYSCVEYSKGSEAAIYLVFPFMDHDLAGLLTNKSAQFTRDQLRFYFYQILKGVKALHDKKVIHRDIKSANILIDNSGNVRIADFGLARVLKQSANVQYTKNVVTLWYRAPELLFGDRQYSTAIDMWSVGCIFAEMLLKEPLFPAKVELEQMGRIFKLCGTPNESNWEGFSKLPGAASAPVRSFVKRNLIESLGTRIKDKTALDLLDKLLVLDPSKRYTAESALVHDYFYVPNEIQKFDPSILPRYKSSFELNMRRRGIRKRPPAPPVGGLPEETQTSNNTKRRFVSQGPASHWTKNVPTKSSMSESVSRTKTVHN